MNFVRIYWYSNQKSGLHTKYCSGYWTTTYLNLLLLLVLLLQCDQKGQGYG